MKGFLVGYIMGASVMLIVAMITIQDIEKQPEIKTCKHVSVHQFRLWQSKYDMYNDSLNFNFLSKHKHRELTDKMNKYADSLNF